MNCKNCKSKNTKRIEFSLPGKVHYTCLDCKHLFSVDSTAVERDENYLMNIEISDHIITCKEDNLLDVVLEIYLIDIHAFLKGVEAKKRGDQYYVSLPCKNALTLDGKADLRYPVFAYADQRKQDILKRLIELKAPEYIDSQVLKESS